VTARRAGVTPEEDYSGQTSVGPPAALRLAMDSADRTQDDRITITSNASAEIARRSEVEQLRPDDADDILELDPADLIEDDDEAAFDER
jgi:hypothetical protein